MKDCSPRSIYPILRLICVHENTIHHRITGELKSKIDKVWEAFWTGGLSNPITVIEQMTYLLFIKRLDELQAQREQKALFLKKTVESPIYQPSQNEIRWSYFKYNDPESMYRLFTKENGVFGFMPLRI